jgi:hypothetical protein
MFQANVMSSSSSWLNLVRSSGCWSLNARKQNVSFGGWLPPIQPRFFTPHVEAVCSSVLSEETSIVRCENPRKGHSFKDNSHEHLKIQIFKCFMVHYNQSILTIRVAADGSGEQSGTCRPWGSSNGSSRITVWVILQNISNRHDISHLSHLPLTSSFS